LLKDISANQGLELILKNTEQLGTEKVFINEALNRVIAQNIKSPLYIPPFNNSAMDGYAIKSIDTENASENSPVKLKLVEEIPAGKVFEGKIKSGEAIKIMTGGKIPEGADAVVRKEDVKEDNGYIFIFNRVSPFKDIREKGEDIKKDETVIFKGDILNPSKIGILASLGIPYIEIYKKPSVVIIPTGNEIVDIEEPLNTAKIRNSNAFTLEALLREWNIIPQKTPIIKDDLNDLKKVIQQNINSNVILSTGGVSVGDYDFIKKVIKDLGFEIIFWRLKIKPGKPLLFAIKDKTLYFVELLFLNHLSHL